MILFLGLSHQFTILRLLNLSFLIDARNLVKTKLSSPLPVTSAIISDQTSMTRFLLRPEFQIRVFATAHASGEDNPHSLSVSKSRLDGYSTLTAKRASSDQWLCCRFLLRDASASDGSNRVPRSTLVWGLGREVTGGHYFTAMTTCCVNVFTRVLHFFTFYFSYTKIIEMVHLSLQRSIDHWYSLKNPFWSPGYIYIYMYMHPDISQTHCWCFSLVDERASFLLWQEFSTLYSSHYSLGLAISLRSYQRLGTALALVLVLVLAEMNPREAYSPAIRSTRYHDAVCSGLLSLLLRLYLE